MQHQARNLAILSDDNIHTVVVCFPDSEKEYRYLAYKDWSLKADDEIYVPLVGSDGFKIATIVEVDDEADIDISMDIKYKFCNGPAKNLVEACETDLLTNMDRINKLRNKKLRAQARQEILNSLLESNDEQNSIN